VDFAMKVINWDSNTIVRIQLWDIAGECNVWQFFFSYCLLLMNNMNFY